MKVSNLVIAMGLVAGGCGAGNEDEDVRTLDQEAVVAYSALSDASTGGTQGFFIFSPWGTTPDLGRSGPTTWPGT